MESTEVINTAGWTTEETQFLFEMYMQNCNNIGPQKMFRSNLHLWNDITKRLNEAFEVQRTTVQCIGRYKSFQKKFKTNSCDNCELTNKVADADEMSSEDETEMSTIARVIRSTLLEIHKLKEEAKERRHRERMHLLEQILRSDITSSNIKMEEESEPEPDVELEHELEPEQRNVPALPVIQRQIGNKVQLTRERLLQIQRTKMEDRERKHKIFKLEQ